jgi:MipA family protein
MELLSAGNRRYYLDTGVEAEFGDAHASLRPYLGLRFKGARFNDHYLGLGEQDMGAGVDLRGTLNGRLHIAGNLYFIGAAGFTWLDEDARDSEFIRDDVSWEVLAGLGIFDDPGTVSTASGTDDYLRASWGWATPANLGEIVRLESKEDPYNNSLSSLFYGRLLTDELFGRPMDVYMTVGAAAHHRSRVQQRGAEYVAAIKLYRTFDWPVRTRLGLAEGLSYVTRVTHVEGSELERKGYRPSKLLNYLDLSVDIHVGDLARSLDGWWLGYGIHHRSGIFESGSQFGRIHGGSNYNTIYLQRHF